MALETLAGLKQIGGFETTRDGIDFGCARPVFIYEDYNHLCFKIQNGPVKERGVNGCQVDTVIETAKIILEGLNSKFPCRENALAITKLDEALMWLAKRKADREARGVEGTEKP